MTTGTSLIEAQPIPSIMREKPGPDVAVAARVPVRAAPEAIVTAAISPPPPTRASTSRRTPAPTPSPPPASDESESREANPVLDLQPEAMDATFAKERDGSILVVQTEDEIAAVTMASGAALTGTRAATATSGPGFSLMMEGIGWASINEVPVVITLYQRAGRHP